VLLPDAVRHALGDEIERLRDRARGVTWVARENLHVTLKFLGDVPPEDLDGVGAALETVVAGRVPFSLAVRGLGAFPVPSRARVVWAGLADGAPALTALASDVDAALAALGFDREQRAFSAHITLGRVREPRRDSGLAALLQTAADRAFGTFTVDEVALMRSDLSPRGARYTRLQGCRLTGG
jgi:2'-5' RNA ligase